MTHSNRGYKVVPAKELANRTDRKKRMNELERRRRNCYHRFESSRSGFVSRNRGLTSIKNNLRLGLSPVSPNFTIFFMAYEPVLFKNINDPRAKEIDRYMGWWL